jgi:HEAT repeat protein
LLSEFAGLHGEHVRPYLSAVADCCAADDDYTRVNATAIVARVAEDRPDAVRDAAVDPTNWLEDDHHLVRVNACWTLGHLADDSAVDTLEAAAADDHEDVRGRAQWALGELTR